MVGSYCIQELGGIEREGALGLFFVFFHSRKTLGQSYYCTFTTVVVVGGDGGQEGFIRTPSRPLPQLYSV